VIEKICGLQGKQDSLVISPKLPQSWSTLNLEYRFRGASITLNIEKTTVKKPVMVVNGQIQDQSILQNIEAGKHYHVELSLPSENPGSLPTVTVVMGVSGSGKTSLAEQIALQTGAVFIEGDDLHSARSKQKMAAGIALNDDDRQPWIERISQCIKQKLQHGYDVVLSYSGLKQAHRQYLTNELSPFTSNTKQLFLNIDFKSAEDRLALRKGHFFQPSLLQSQFDALELPSEEGVELLEANQTIEQLVSLVFGESGENSHAGNTSDNRHQRTG
jgi:carbohydrate kinase (thermoresistant glucokinase family)